ncbi:Uncharacterized protein FWK35_00002681 [Aphis craccivora]|uniref:Uncharacterized protein n=1 Tax=Aphis craccivora TaxID=307492 RepID=A0A6G0ZP55_APHCR|nr:Uncharacterized protein FWK35_00002681 [Aphis craccivora]
MKSMRLLILLTFILYETQCAPSIKPLTFLKSLLSKHLPSTTEHPLPEEEIYSAYKCEPVEEGAIDDAAIDWNRQVFLVNDKPVLIEVGNVQPIQNVNHDEVVAVNPEINPEVNCDENAEVNLEVITKDQLEQNFELRPEVENKDVYDKDLNTQWLLGENTSERLPEIDVTIGKSSIKDKLINKINLIKSKLKFKNRLVIPIVESIEENNNNVEITSGKPITTLEPIKPPSSTVQYITTTLQYSTTAQPITSTHQYSTTAQPITSTHQYSTTAQPITSTHQYSTTLQPVTSTQQYSTTLQPITSTQQYSTTLQPISTSAQPVQYTSTVKPDGYTPNVQINGGIESQEPVITIPTQHQIPLQHQQIYNSDSSYPLWLNNCPPPLSNQICFHQIPYYAPSPIYTSALNANQFTLENLPYNTPDRQNKKINNGLTKVINYIKIDATQPVQQIKPNQDEQWIRYTYDDSKPVYQNPSYYISQPANSESQPESAFPSSDDLYSTSTMQPIVVYPVDANNILPVNQIDQTQYNWDQLLEPATVNSNDEGSKYTMRGDIPIVEDFNPNTNYDQLEADSAKYTLKERRHVGHYNELVSKKTNQKMPIPVSEISSGKPVTEVAETETQSNKIDIPAATETKIPTTKIIETPITKIEKPVVKIGTPAITVTDTPHPKSNNVNTGV